MQADYGTELRRDISDLDRLYGRKPHDQAARAGRLVRTSSHRR